jgi:hypothetical protein
VDHPVQRTPALLEAGRYRFDLGSVGDIQFEHVNRLGQSLRHPLRDRQAAPEAGQYDLGALLLRQTRDREGDGGLGQHPRDEQALALKQHVGSRSLGQVVLRRA